MAEGRALGEQIIELARTRMPVAPGDLAVGGRDLLALLPQEQLKNAFSYLLERVQSGNLPNDRDALLAAVRKNIKRRQNAATI